MFLITKSRPLQVSLVITPHEKPQINKMVLYRLHGHVSQLQNKSTWPIHDYKWAKCPIFHNVMNSNDNNRYHARDTHQYGYISSHIIGSFKCCKFNWHISRYSRFLLHLNLLDPHKLLDKWMQLVEEHDARIYCQKNLGPSLCFEGSLQVTH